MNAEQINNGTRPHIQDLELLNRFRNWEAGFELYDQGQPIEVCDTGHPTRTKTRKSGWLASQRISELKRNQEASGVVRERWREIKAGFDLM